MAGSEGKPLSEEQKGASDSFLGTIAQCSLQQRNVAGFHTLVRVFGTEM